MAVYFEVEGLNEIQHSFMFIPLEQLLSFPIAVIAVCKVSNGGSVRRRIRKVTMLEVGRWKGHDKMDIHLLN